MLSIAFQDGAEQADSGHPSRTETHKHEIIRLRTGLDDHQQSLTLEEIGQRFGITKEQVRQLNARAMKKLRRFAEERHIDLS